MRLRLLALTLFMMLATAAEARRVALVIGQDAYPGGSSATVGLPPLSNSRLDARALAELLARNGFDVISCDGKAPGCFDLDRQHLLGAIDDFEKKAADAELALVYYAGHGLASEEGNILAPTDARISCDTGAITDGVPVERFLNAANGAPNKLVILDACRNNPIGDICPSLKGKKLSFTRIEAGAMQGLLLVTSTQFGQEALDGANGGHSPFAAALLQSLAAHQSVYFEQLMNEVARQTYEAAKANGGFVQIPGKVVGGAAPADCLAGKDCIGDARMAALAAENEGLAAEASGVRNIITAEEKARGRPYTLEERKKRVLELGDTLARLASSSDPLRREAKSLIEAGNLKGGEKKLDEALDADEKAISEAERVAAEKRKAAAQSARDLAVLALGRDVNRAIDYFKRATRLNPDDATSWQELGQAAISANQLDVAFEALDQADRKGAAFDKPRDRYWALLGLGDIELARGNLERAAKRYGTAMGFARQISEQRPQDAIWRRDILAAEIKLGDIELALADTSAAAKTYAAVLADALRLAQENPKSASRQQDVSIAYQKMGEALFASGNYAKSLDAFMEGRAAIRRADALAPNDVSIETTIAITNEKIGDTLISLGKEEQSFEAYKEAHDVWKKLVATDSGNVDWQRGLSIIDERLGDHAIEMGNFDEAISHFEASLRRMTAIRDRDPRNAAMQRFSVVTMTKIGKAREKKQDLDGALRIYADALPIIERLTRSDPANAQWQRDRAIVSENRGSIFKKLNRTEDARTAYRTALTAYDEMLVRRPDDYQAKLLSVVPLSHLSELEPKLARQHLEKALTILRELKAAGRLDAMREGWIAILEQDVAKLNTPSTDTKTSAVPKPAPAETSSTASPAGKTTPGTAAKTATPAKKQPRAPKSDTVGRSPFDAN